MSKKSSRKKPKGSRPRNRLGAKKGRSQHRWQKTGNKTMSKCRRCGLLRVAGKAKAKGPNRWGKTRKVETYRQNTNSKPVEKLPVCEVA